MKLWKGWINQCQWKCHFNYFNHEMAVSCPEVMYGAYYPYLYGRAGPSRPFYQYERVN